MVTIGIPFYNAEKYLGDAIASVFAQTYTKWELILIDDGSSDNSLEIAKSIDDPRVRVYSDGKNKRLASRLNELIKLAKYDFIARMDADDLISPTRIEKQMKILLENPNIDLVSTGVFSITDKKKLIGSRGDEARSVSFEQLMSKQIGVVHAAIVARKSWYERNNYDTTLKVAQDYDLWLRASSKNDFNIILLSEPLYYYREEGNVTSQKLLNAFKNERVMYKKYAKKYPLKYIIKSHLKSFIVKLLVFFNKTDILLKKRAKSPINNDLIRRFNKELEILKNTSIPLKKEC